MSETKIHKEKKTLHHPASQWYKAFVMGIVKMFCSVSRNQTEVEDNNSPTELSAVCFGTEDRSYYSVLNRQRLRLTILTRT